LSDIEFEGRDVCAAVKDNAWTFEAKALKFGLEDYITDSVNVRIIPSIKSYRYFCCLRHEHATVTINCDHFRSSSAKES